MSSSPLFIGIYANTPQGMGRLEVFAENLSTKYDRHQERLKQVEEKTNHILEKIDSIAASATSLGNYVSGGYKLAELWPYVVFPVASLVMGSYGLQPSLGRNLWLVGLGKSTMQHTHTHTHPQHRRNRGPSRSKPRAPW